MQSKNVLGLLILISLSNIYGSDNEYGHVGRKKEIINIPGSLAKAYAYIRNAHRAITNGSFASQIDKHIESIQKVEILTEILEQCPHKIPAQTIYDLKDKTHKLIETAIPLMRQAQ